MKKKQVGKKTRKMTKEEIHYARRNEHVRCLIGKKCRVTLPDGTTFLERLFTNRGNALRFSREVAPGKFVCEGDYEEYAAKHTIIEEECT